jgi:hypothetical protein
MRKLVRHVLVPWVGAMELVKVLRGGGVKVKLIGEWPEVSEGAGVWKVPFAREEREVEGMWEGVGCMVHFSPNGVVLPVEVEGAGGGVKVVCVGGGEGVFVGAVGASWKGVVGRVRGVVGGS